MNKKTTAAPKMAERPAPKPEREICHIRNWKVNVAGANYILFDDLVDRIETLDALDCNLEISVETGSEYVTGEYGQSGKYVSTKSVVFNAIKREGPQPA